MPNDKTKSTFSVLLWAGPQRLTLNLLTLKSLIFMAFAILTVVEVSLYSKWSKSWGSAAQAEGSLPYSNFWVRAGYILILESIFSLVCVYLIHTSKFTPLVALISACVMFVLWISATLTNALVAYSGELSFPEDDLWYNMCWAETGLGAAIALIYLVVVGDSAVGVHKARRSKSGRERIGADV